MENTTYALTGNIGCGKSTVARYLASMPDVIVIDCDRIAKAVMNAYTLRPLINEILGLDVYPDGLINRQAIASVIFSDTEKKKQLEDLVHPFVWAKVEEVVSAAEPGKICVVESAIIYECHDENRFAGIIVATCSREEQIKRLVGPRGMKQDDAERRINRQMSSEEKERRAQFVIRTDCSLVKLENRVKELYQKLLNDKGENHAHS